METKRGQSSTETLVMVGFIAAFSLPIIMLLYGATNTNGDELSLSQARVDVQNIADVANELYAQGAPSNRVILVNYPSSLQNITIRQGTNAKATGEIVFTLNTTKGNTQIVANTFFPDVLDAPTKHLDDERRSAGAITINSGLHVINLTATNITVGGEQRIAVLISYVNNTG